MTMMIAIALVLAVVVILVVVAMLEISVPKRSLRALGGGRFCGSETSSPERMTDGSKFL